MPLALALAGAFCPCCCCCCVRRARVALLPRSRWPAPPLLSRRRRVKSAHPTAAAAAAAEASATPRAAGERGPAELVVHGAGFGGGGGGGDGDGGAGGGTAASSSCSDGRDVSSAIRSIIRWLGVQTLAWSVALGDSGGSEGGGGHSAQARARDRSLRETRSRFVRPRVWFRVSANTRAAWLFE